MLFICLFVCLFVISGETPTLYTVIPEKTAAVGAAMMGSSHVYELGAVAPTAAGATTTKKVNSRYNY